MACLTSASRTCLRVLARPRPSRAAGCRPGSTAERRARLSRCSACAALALPDHAAGAVRRNDAYVPPVAFFAVTAICTIGLYIAYMIPVYLRWRAGDDSSRVLDPRPQVQVDQHRVAIFVVLCRRSSSACPFTTLACRGTTTSTGLLQLHAAGARWSSARRGLAWVFGKNKRYTGPVRRSVRRGHRSRGDRAGAGRGLRRRRRRPEVVGTERRPGGPAARAACSRSTTCARRSRRARSTPSSPPSPTCRGGCSGKRIQVEYFLDEVVEHGVEGCNYLLALDMEMEPVAGYEMANWESGYGDFAIAPDMATLRRIPWLDRTALVMCDVVEHDGSPGRRLAAPDPDRRSTSALAERATRRCRHRARVLSLQGELRRGPREGLPRPRPRRTRTSSTTTSSRRRWTSSISADPPRDARGRDPGRVLQGRGLVRPARGQHPLRATRVTAADRHAIYKNGVKEIAFLNGISATFMAKPSEKDIGSSCHIHSSLLGDGRQERLRRRRRGDRHLPPLPRRHARRIRELALFIAPLDQLLQALRGRELGADLDLLGPRQPHLLACGSSATGSRGGSSAGSRRRRQPLPRRSRRCSPPGCDGIENETDPGPELEGNAYEAGEAEPFPSTLREAVELWEGSEFAERRVRRGGRRPLPELRSHRAARSSTRSSPTTSAAGCSSAVSGGDRRDRDLRRGRAGALGAMGRGR